MKLNYNKGIAGTETLLAIIAAVFIMGILIFSFIIVGVNLQETQLTTVSADVINETTTGPVNNTGYSLFGASVYNDCSASAITVTNGTLGGIGEVIDANNYTITNCVMYGIAAPYNLTSNWNVTYTYSGTQTTTASEVINDTYQSMSDLPTWFPIFITFAAIVVLILLIVLMLNALRNSGFIGGEGAA